MTRFLVVPQWQGSPAARAMLLRDGAEAIAGDLPRSATVELEVPLESGDALGTGIHRLSAIRRVADLLDAALDGIDERVVVIGGDCSVSVAAASRHADGDLAVVWIDAHPDLNDPASSPSGALAGMALRALTGGVPEATARGNVRPEHVVLAGVRDIDEAERAYIEAHGIPVVQGDALADPDALARAVAATGASRVYVHIDLDVIDPSELGGTLWGVPFGLAVADLAAALVRLKQTMPLVGATIAGFAPASPAAAVDDLGAILRLVGAVA